MNAYRRGKDAGMHGLHESDNPYEPGTRDYEDWLEGFYYEEVMEKTRRGRVEWQ